jgi:hypothetical protein
MEPKDRHLIRVSGISFAALYVVLVGIFALWKASSMPQSNRLSWAEVLYGPAITILSCFLLFLGAVGIEHLIKSGKDAK